MPGKGHHTAEFDDCVQKVMEKGNDESSAYAICTASFQKAGKPILNSVGGIPVVTLEALGEQIALGKEAEASTEDDAR